MSENLEQTAIAPAHEVNELGALPSGVPAGIKAEQYSLDNGEVLRFTPEVVRRDEVTGEPVAPVVYVQGMNGNGKLANIMGYLAGHDQRQVIAVRYNEKVSTSPEPIRPSMAGYREDAVIPELDVQRTNDLLFALSTLGDVKKVSIVAESAGAVRALLLADSLSKGQKTDELSSDSSGVNVENLLLVDPAGQDGRSYRQTHFDALKLARAEKRNAKIAGFALESIAATAEISAVAKQRRDRPEQRAVAYAQLQSVLAEVSARVPVRVLSDVSDVAFRTDRIAEQMESSGAAQHAQLIQTDKGGHGVGLNKLALDTVITNLHELEHAI